MKTVPEIQIVKTPALRDGVKSATYAPNFKKGVQGSRHGNKADIERFNEIFSKKPKSDAVKLLVDSYLRQVPDVQFNKILKTIKAAPGGQAAKISLKYVKENKNIRVILERNGKVNGFQRFSHEITPNGDRLRIVQTAYDDLRKLVRQKPGYAKNNLYDIKKVKGL